MAGSATSKSPDSLQSGSAPRSPARVMGVIEALALRPDGLTLSALSRDLELPKTSLFHLLRALEQESYVVNARGAWRLGVASLRLGSMIGGVLPSWQRIGVLLPALAARCGETALLAVPTEERQEVLYVDIADGPEAIRFAAVVGTRRPLYNTAAGRIVLAYCDDAFVQRYLLSVRRKAATRHTTIDRAELRKAIEDVRRTGVAETRDQTVVGVWGFGAPVFDAGRNLVAAVMIAAPSERGRQKHIQLAAAVRDAGQEMSRILGLSGTYIDS